MKYFDTIIIGSGIALKESFTQYKGKSRSIR